MYVFMVIEDILYVFQCDDSALLYAFQCDAMRHYMLASVTTIRHHAV